MDEPSTFITVSQLTFAIKNQLESRFIGLTVQGEVSNAKLHSSGHLYFDLKDSEAKIGAVMFRPQSQQLKRPPKEGDQVIVKGALSVYPPHGKYQMIVRSLEYQGVGELLLKLEILKKKLHGLGWFDPARKKTIPKFPRTIGVVTSPTGAVIQDMIHILKRRLPSFHLLLYPVRVQGAEAPAEIAQAIAEFNRYGLADVLIVGRGGGSLEDLWAFNEEMVVKAIFESRIPIISAVGHETDVTLADFVADMRAPTPSSAAEIVSAEKNYQQEFLNKAEKNLAYTLSHHLKRYQAYLESYKRHPLFASPYALLAAPLQHLDDLKEKIDGTLKNLILKKRVLLQSRQREACALKPTAQLTLFHNQLHHLEKRLNESSATLLNVKRQKLHTVLQRLSALDPKQVLKRGYSILFAEKGGSVIVSAQSVRAGEKLRALLSDGEIKLKVDDE
jgi:exodeoxyribonuclease VII large subunit